MPLVSPLTIVDGELVDVSGNTPIHNRLRDYLISLLSEYVKKNGLGEVISEQEYDFGGNAHGPDISFYVKEKIPLVDERRRVQRFVPDLAIEIVSQNDTFEKLVQKADRYRKSGTQEVWVLDIESRKAFVFSPGRNEILDEDQPFAPGLIPGLSVRIGDVLDRR
jgi:Uma2 family endonuclease